MLKRYKDFLSLTKARKTTYGFSSKKVSTKDLSYVLEAARWSPSCGNIQPWHFIVVQKKNNITKLLNNTHVINAPFIHPLPQLLICFELPSEEKLHFDATVRHCCNHSVCPQHKNELDLCLSMAVFSAALAATDRGLASCILTPDAKQASDILKTKGRVRLLLGIGHEAKNAFQKERTRVPLKELISYERGGGRWRTNS